MFRSFWFVSLSVSRIAYKVINGFACMKLLSEVYLGPKNILINLEDDPDYDRNPGSGSRSVSRGGSLQSLTDCLVIYVIRLFCNYRFASRYLIDDSTLKRYEFCL